MTTWQKIKLGIVVFLTVGMVFYCVFQADENRGLKQKLPKVEVGENLVIRAERINFLESRITEPFYRISALKADPKLQEEVDSLHAELVRLISLPNIDQERESYEEYDENNVAFKKSDLGSDLKNAIDGSVLGGSSK